LKVPSLNKKNSKGVENILGNATHFQYPIRLRLKDNKKNKEQEETYSPWFFYWCYYFYWILVLSKTTSHRLVACLLIANAIHGFWACSEIYHRHLMLYDYVHQLQTDGIFPTYQSSHHLIKSAFLWVAFICTLTPNL